MVASYSELLLPQPSCQRVTAVLVALEALPAGPSAKPCLRYRVAPAAPGWRRERCIEPRPRMAYWGRGSNFRHGSRFSTLGETAGRRERTDRDHARRVLPPGQ